MIIDDREVWIHRTGIEKLVDESDIKKLGGRDRYKAKLLKADFTPLVTKEDIKVEEPVTKEEPVEQKTEEIKETPKRKKKKDGESN